MMKENWVYRRGDIYMANLNPFKGSEQGGTRPVLVLQNNTGNLFCPTLIVAPLTTQVNKKKDQPHIHREIRQVTYIQAAFAKYEFTRCHAIWIGGR